MNRMMLIGLIVVLVIGGGLTTILGMNGLFYTPKATEKVMGPYAYAYEDFTGPYSKTFPVFSKVYKLLTDNGIVNTVGIGIYHDDPATVTAKDLRSSCGSVINPADLEKAASLGLKTGAKEAQQSIVIEFPTKSGLSYMIAPSKCYPVLTKYVTEKGYQMTAPYEVYDMPNKKMYVVMDLVM